MWSVAQASAHGNRYRQGWEEFRSLKMGLRKYPLGLVHPTAPVSAAVCHHL
ncbi:hypothetical protein G5B00_08525 [Parapedobacter sp. SGR-10]|nr:hypothetical protein [Parapedobacter sp. SGR-10]